MAAPLILGAGMMLGGTALNMYGTSQREKASRKALKQYQQAVGQRTDAERNSLMQQSGALYGLSQDRQAGVGAYLTDLASSQNQIGDAGFGERQEGALTGIRDMTQGSDNGYAYSGAPRTQAEGMQNDKTLGDNRRLSEALLADDELRRIQAGEQAAGHRMAFGDIRRSAKGTSMQQRFALAKALRDLDWQRKTAAMQGKMDEAQRVGQTMNMLGGLSTQAGSMLAMYGGGQSGQGGAGGGTSIDSGYTIPNEAFDPNAVGPVDLG